MIIVMRPHAADEEILAVEASIASLELTAHVSRGAERTIVGVIGGYQQGGDTPSVSYGVRFSPAILQLYRQAVAAEA